VKNNRSASAEHAELERRAERSQALTLHTRPVVFLCLDRMNAWFTGASRRKAARMSGGSADLRSHPAVIGMSGEAR
jgi:hypothetical protein